MTDLTFEDCLTRLEQIVAALEGGKLSLDESLKVFEEGVALSRRCSRYLEDAERRIELLTRDEASVLETRPFTGWEREGES
jgi:exodeoxyribonuclease VII small subunit